MCFSYWPENFSISSSIERLSCQQPLSGVFETFKCIHIMVMNGWQHPLLLSVKLFTVFCQTTLSWKDRNSRFEFCKQHTLRLERVTARWHLFHFSKSLGWPKYASNIEFTRKIVCSNMLFHFLNSQTWSVLGLQIRSFVCYGISWHSWTKIWLEMMNPRANRVTSCKIVKIFFG